MGGMVMASRSTAARAARYNRATTITRLANGTAITCAAIVCGLLVVLVACAAYLLATQAIHFALN